MTALVVKPGGRLRGQVNVPGDKSISHRVLMLAALADGVSTIKDLSNGRDVASTRQILEDLGAQVLSDDNGVRIIGGSLGPVPHDLDVGNSGTTIRLLAGMLAGLGFRAVLDGDESIRKRPMDRVLAPLREMGAEVSGRNGGDLAPLVVDGGGLSGIEYTLPVASAQVKGCVLFAGLSAEGPTTVIENHPTRTHSEDLMAITGIEIERTSVEGVERTTVHPGRPKPFDYEVCGDPSQAAFWVVAASIVSDSEVLMPNIYRGSARLGFIKVLQRMGADLTHDPDSGDLSVRSADLVGTVVTSGEVPALVDEVPILAVAAACAEGETIFKGLGELRVKESDRLAALESELTRMGVAVEVCDDDLVIQGLPGGVGLRGTRVDAHHDHRIAMSCAVAALVADRETTVEGWEVVATSYPDFSDHLSSLRSSSDR